MNPVLIQEKALENFRTGMNCAQAVLTAYSDVLNFDAKLAENITFGFGGGMARLQKTCGAVTGSFMALSIYCCNKDFTENERKEKTYSVIQDFHEKFEKIHGSSDCKHLLNCDLKTEEGRSYAKQNNLFETVCEKCITNSVNIINNIIINPN